MARKREVRWGPRRMIQPSFGELEIYLVRDQIRNIENSAL